eukprot:COSAG01_NODE_66126_length_271_cov_0.604651_1_plen_20_part_10
MSSLVAAVGARTLRPDAAAL